MRYFFYLCFILCPINLLGQQGHYFLSHYSPINERVDRAAYSIVQDDSGIFYLATRSGILQFDGKNWDLIETTGAVYSVKISDDGSIFWAGANGMGKLIESANGSKSIQVLLSEKDFYQIIALKNKIFFLSEKTIYSYVDDKNLTKISSSDATGSFSYLFELYGLIYVSTDEGIFRIDNNDLKSSNLKIQENPAVVFAARDEERYLLATSDNRLWVGIQGHALKEIKIQDDQYINASVITSGSWINSQLVALGTLRGGVIFLNPLTGQIQEIINYNTGLPDNEIFSLTRDVSGNLWVSHEYGLTRIAPFFPFRSFSHYENLKGNLLCATSIGNEVYVGTSLGLFKLVKEEVYDEIIYYEEVSVASETKKDKTEDKPIEDDKSSQPEVKRKRGILGFLKRNRNTETANEEPAKETQEERNKNQPSKRVTRKLKKTERILRSSQYVYKKVNGIEAKVTHLSEFNGKLIAAGLAGVFEVNELESKVILEEPVRYIFSTKNNLLLVSTYTDRVQLFNRKEDGWNNTQLLNSFEDQIQYAFESSDNRLWLCSDDKLYIVAIANEQVTSIDSVAIDNPSFSKIFGLPWKDEVLITNAKGFYRFDQKNQSIVKIDSLPVPKTYFVTPGNMWYHDDHAWKVLGQFKDYGNVDLLNICNDIRFIASDNKGKDIWIITGNNELYKFFSHAFSTNTLRHPLQIKSISQADERLPFHNRLRIQQEEGLLTLEIEQPNYINPEASEYRYFLKGINDNKWSEWSATNSRISFPYLPTGNYELMIQSRDIFGQISEIDPLKFEVRPPFWKSSWFYAMEFAVFVLLVMLSFKLSVRYRIISRFLSLLTIILLIEFIQTVAGYTFSTNSSPVIDFIIQVIIAFMVLPVEMLLRNLMFRSMGSGTRLYKVISDLDKEVRGKK